MRPTPNMPVVRSVERNHWPVDEPRVPRGEEPLPASRHLLLTEMELKPVRAFPTPPIVEEVDCLSAIRIAVQVQKVCQALIQGIA